MKRPASSIGTRSKRSRAERDPVADKCELVGDSMGASSLPRVVQQMLAEMSLFSLGVPQDARHEFQEAVVDMIGSAVAESEVALKKAITDAETLVNGGDDEQAKRQAEVEAATAALTAASEATAEKRSSLDSLVEALNAAKEADATARTAQSDGDAELVTTEKKKTQLEEVVNNLLTPLLDGVSGDKKSHIKELLVELKNFDVEQSLLNAAPLALSKEKDARGSFDDMVLAQLKDVVAQRREAYDTLLSQAEPAKAARAAAVQEAEQKLQGAEEAKQQGEMVLSEAAAQEQEQTWALKRAEKALKNFWPEQNRAAKSLDRAKVSLEKFQNASVAAFEELKVRKEVPEVEAAAEDAEAAEDAPAEAAPAEAAPAEDAPMEAAAE